MKQTERTITIIEYESDDGKVKSEDKEIVETYEAQKDPIEAITYITVAKLTGIQDESVYKIESEEEFTKLKYQLYHLDDIKIHSKYIPGCLYYVLDYVEVDYDYYDYYELVSLDSFYKDLKDRVEEDKQSLEINEQALWEVNSLKENLANIDKNKKKNS